MLVCTYSIRDESPKVNCQIQGKRNWLVELYITDGIERITKTLRNKDRAYLPELLSTSLNELTSMWPELDQVTDAGFTVKLLR
jgi:hypothetical protein